MRKAQRPPPPPAPSSSSSSSTSKSSSAKPFDLAAELAAKKKNLAKVETKDLSVPNVQKNESSSQETTGNSMMAMIMAKRNAMKKATGSSTNPVKPPISKPIT